MISCRISSFAGSETTAGYRPHTRENTMSKVLNSLQTKLIASFLLLILAIAGGSFLFTYNQTKKALLESTREDLLQIIGIASTQFSPPEIEQIQRLQPGEDTSPGYVAIKKKLQTMRSMSPNVENFYIMQVQGEKIVFFVDDLDDDPAKIGQVYEQPETKVFAAVNSPQVSDDLYTDEWGTFLSGYAPILGTSGASTLIIGGDILATKVIERQNFIGNTIYYVMGFAILLAGVIIGVFSLTIIRDILKLIQAAEKISMGDTNVSIDIHRKDEIGDLAQSFGRMVASLKIMMATDAPTAQSGRDSAKK
jgi:methyl-accepting chemotaxis protein